MGNRSGAAAAAVLTLLAGVAAVTLVVLFDQIEHLTLFLLIFILLLLGAVPIALRVSRGTFDLFEPIVPYFAMFFLTFGAGALFTVLIRGVAYDGGVLAYLDLTVAYCTLGYACVMLGYALAGRVVRARGAGPAATPGWAAIALLFGVGAVGELFVAGLEAQPFVMNSLVTGIVSLMSQLSFLTTFTFFYTLYLVLARRADVSLKLLLFGLMIPVKLLNLFLRIGNKSTLILTAGLIFVAIWYARGRVPWKSLLAFALIVVFFVFPFYYTYRYTGVKGDQAYRLEKSFKKLGEQQASEYSSDALKTVARRLAVVNSTVLVVRDAGSRVDFQYGSTLALGVVSALIPRFLWPDKPTTNIGKQFGKTFHITGFSNYSSITPTMVGELYWNFHVPGVILGMFLMGALMRTIYLRFRTGGESNPVRLAMYVTLVYATALGSEGGIGAFEGRLFKETVLLLAIEKGMLLLQVMAERRAGSGVQGPAFVTEP